MKLIKLDNTGIRIYVYAYALWAPIIIIFSFSVFCLLMYSKQANTNS